MGKNYSLNDARNYAKEFYELGKLNEIDYMKFGKSLKMFAEKSEEANFKMIINKYIELVEIHGNIMHDNKFSNRKKINQEVYSFLEFICSGMDNQYTLNFFSNLTKKSVKERNATKMFKENYFIEENFKDLTSDLQCNNPYKLNN